MWKELLASFNALLENSGVSSSFCGAACEAGIMEVMQGILKNTQLQDSYMKNAVSFVHVPLALNKIIFSHFEPIHRP